MLPLQMRPGDRALIAGRWQTVLGVAEDAPELGVVQVLTGDAETPWTLPAGVELEVWPLPPVDASSLVTRAREALGALQLEAAAYAYALPTRAEAPAYRVYRVRPGCPPTLVGTAVDEASATILAAGARGQVEIRPVGGARC